MNKDYEYLAYFIYTCNKCGTRINNRIDYFNSEEELETHLNKQPDEIITQCSNCKKEQKFINKECYIHIKKKDECLHIDWFKLGINQ